MKTVIILLNFLLISLILWSFLNSKVVEYFSGCPSGQNNKVTQQSSQLSQNESQLSKLQAQYNQLYMLSTLQNIRIQANGQNVKQISGDVMKQKDEKTKELDKLNKEFKGGNIANVSGGGSKLNKLGKIMANSPSQSF